MTPTRRMFLAAAGSAALCGAAPAPADAQAQGFFAENGVAIRGTDPVACFTEGRPVRGSRAHAFDWGGVRWHFASAANRDAFAANPEAYAPQFGGYCAWAVSENHTASIDPAAWRIVDGKLYLNYSRGVQRQWERDIPRHIARGEANWPALRATLD
jgi:YHS domain-containing protein